MDAGLVHAGMTCKKVRHSRVISAGIHDKKAHNNTLRISKHLDAR